MAMGITHQQAPELRVPYWIDAHGQERDPLKLSDLGDGYKIIYCFQSWCPGCHSRGFPTLQKLVNELSDKKLRDQRLAHKGDGEGIGVGFGFAVVQTVFEGEEKNTRDQLVEMQNKYNLRIPFGHDIADGHYPTVMEDYRTAGTPWFILIDPKGEVIFNDFGLDADKLIDAVLRPDVEVA